MYHASKIVNRRGVGLLLCAGGALSLCACSSSSRHVAATDEAAPQAGVAQARPMNGIFDDPAALSSASYSTRLAVFGEGNGAELNGALRDTAPGENYRQISFAQEGTDFDPALSPDGSLLYYASTAHATNADIYVKSVDGRTVTQLTNDPASDVMPVVSPDGTRIAFASNRNGTWDLFVINTSGGPAVEITADASQELHPTWSPDGRSIAYCRLGETSGRWEIWVTEVNRNAVKRFLTYGLFPAWHPTSPKIAFQRARERGERLFSIWTLDLVKGEATALTEIASSPIAALVNPAWSADGAQIAFSAIMNPATGAPENTPVVADVWVTDIRGGGRTNITGGHYSNLMPTWGPENSLYFVSDRGGTETVWAADTSNARIAATPVEGRSAVAQSALSGRSTGAPAPRTTTAVLVEGPQIVTHATEPSPLNPEPMPEIANVPLPNDH